MRLILSISRSIFLFLLLAHTSNAQICREKGSTAAPPSGYSYINCDQTYRDLSITCSNSAEPANPGTRPACPAKPMPMITTPMKSFISDYTPYLYAYPRDSSDRSKPYDGSYLSGPSGSPEKVFKMVGNSATGTKRLAGCTAQIHMPNDPTNTSDEAKFIRLQLDNCTNQYILNNSLFPFQKSRARLINNPEISSDVITLETECQPLKTFTETENEYHPEYYLYAAWMKTMYDPKFRYTEPFTPPAALKIAEKYFIGGDMLATGEPSLPNGVTIDNPIAPPGGVSTDATGMEGKKKNPTSAVQPVPLSAIAAVPYEEINDPTHPFSPRWDFMWNERDFYSPMTAAYMDKTANSVYCAGVKEAKNETDSTKKANLEVKVDVLGFRKAKFEDGLLRRIAYNSLCKVDTIDATANLFVVAATSYCFKPVVPTVVACATSCIVAGCSACPNMQATYVPCWKCFGLGSSKVDDDKKHPPCTTRYDGQDQDMVNVIGITKMQTMLTNPIKLLKFVGTLAVNNQFAGGMNLFNIQPTCNMPYTDHDDTQNMDKLCQDLRKPYTQINKLKMRYHNPDDKNNIVLTNGVQEGFAFSDYFGNHMPYPRLWDTGLPLLKSPSTDSMNQPPTDTTGQYTAIVGIGREAAPASAPTDANGKKPSDLHKDERCLLGGWGGSLSGAIPYMSFSGVQIALPDPMSSWTEFKMYQTHATRQIGLSCIGRYEKMFKSGSTENVILSTAGGEWGRTIVSKCAVKKKLTDAANCSYLTLKDYLKNKSTYQNDKTIYTIPEIKSEGWPLAWRGYISTTGSNQFPNFAGTPTSLVTGLDNAQIGDVLLLPNGTVPDGTKPGLAKISLVVEVNLPSTGACVTRKDCYVKVVEADNGKWPDSCGITDTWGSLQSRYLYKPGNLPSAMTVAFDSKHVDYTTNCEDTKLGSCELSTWNTLQLYRIRSDIRSGCPNNTTAEKC